MQTSRSLINALRPKISRILVVAAFAATGVQAAELPEVTVAAPAVKTIGRDATGAPIKQVRATARVKYSPIMLTTNSGRALLQYKIADVARELCMKMDTVALSPMDDAATCVQRAIDGTKAQIAAAIAQQTG